MTQPQPPCFKTSSDPGSFDGMPFYVSGPHVTYGIGGALAAGRGDDPERLALLQRLYRDWPFFRALLDNSQMSPSKVDAGIAREYARLCADTDTETGIYERFRAEYEQTCREILAVAQIPTLLKENPTPAKSLERRNPYLDPLNHIQVALIPRYRRHEK